MKLNIVLLILLGFTNANELIENQLNEYQTQQIDRLKFIRNTRKAFAILQKKDFAPTIIPLLENKNRKTQNMVMDLIEKQYSYKWMRSLRESEPSLTLRWLRLLNRPQIRFFEEVIEFASSSSSEDVEKACFKKLAEYGPFLDNRTKEQLFDLCVKHIKKSSPETIKNICEVFAGIGIPDSIPELIWALENVPQAKGKALYALRKISGLRFSSKQTGKWQRWWKSQVLLYQNTLGNAQLDWNNMPSHQLVKEISNISFLVWRDMASEFLIYLLNHKNPQVRISICKALKHLHKKISIKPLLETMANDQNPNVQREAWIALQSITQKNYPFNDNEWFYWFKTTQPKKQ